MSSSKFTASLYLLTFFSLIYGILGASSVYSYCPITSDTLTSNEPYETNLKELMSYLSYHMDPTGFALGSKGHDENQVHGFALCYGNNISAIDCKNCLADATQEIYQNCSLSKEAIMWYENCQIKYSNNNFLGQIDNQMAFSISNAQNISSPATFNEMRMKLLGRIGKQASEAPEMYARGDLPLDNSTTLYGSGQCTSDLTSYDCNKCVEGVISELPYCCTLSQGARFHTESCYIRYEIFEF